MLETGAMMSTFNETSMAVEEAKISGKSIPVVTVTFDAKPSSIESSSKRTSSSSKHADAEATISNASPASFEATLLEERPLNDGKPHNAVVLEGSMQKSKPFSASPVDFEIETNEAMAVSDEAALGKGSIEVDVLEVDACETVLGQAEQRDGGEQQVSSEKEQEMDPPTQLPETPTQDDNSAAAGRKMASIAELMPEELASVRDEPLISVSVPPESATCQDATTTSTRDKNDSATRRKSIWGVLLPSTTTPSITPLPIQPAPSRRTAPAHKRFSLFSRKTTANPPPPSNPQPARLSRTRIDETALANLIISCADARHILKTSSDAEQLRAVGLKLERGWRAQLDEAQQLRAKLQTAEDTVADVEDENRQLRVQLGTLSEEVVMREDEVSLVKAECEAKVESARREEEERREEERRRWETRIKEWERRWREEISFSLGLGMILTQRSDDGLLLNKPIDGEEMRRLALAQARPMPSHFEEPLASYVDEDLFRCPTHRFAHSAAAPPSTLVDERVLLVGTDRRLFQALVQKLSALGLTRVAVATPAGSEMHLRGVSVVSFVLEASDAWDKLTNAVSVDLGGAPDCIVNAFDALHADQLSAISRLLSAQCQTKQPSRSVINAVYDIDAKDPLCTFGLLGLTHALSTTAARFNTLIHACQRPQLGVDAIVRLIDPCSTTNGSVVAVDPHHVRCLGPPLCTNKAGSKGGPLGGEEDAERPRRLRARKQLADVELWEALEEENRILRERVMLLEGAEETASDQ